METIQTNQDGAATPALSIRSICRSILHAIAFILAFVPPILKMYETSHWFRSEDDPSPYDNARGWFETAKLPFARAFHFHDKTMMRVFLFIIPFIVSSFLMAVVHMIKPVKFASSPTFSTPRSHLILRSLVGHAWQIPSFAKRFLWAPSQFSTAELLGIAAYLVVNIGTFAVRVK